MASCDDDFSLLRHDQQQHTPYPPPPPPRRFNLNPSNQIHHRSNNGDDVVVEAASSAFHSVNLFPADENSNPYVNNNDDDANRSSIEKRQIQEEVSDGGTATTTPYGSGFKRPRRTSSSSSAGGGEYRRDREEWSDAAISCLLDLYLDKLIELNRGNLRGRDWEEVASMVSERCEKLNKSVEQCKNKIDNLKKRYKLERTRMSNGGVLVSHWPWFKKMEEIVGNSLAGKVVSDEDRSGSSLGNAVKPVRR